MNKSQAKLFEAIFSANLPILENLLEGLCSELGHEDQIDAMKAKFLYQDRKKFTKILNKKSNVNKRRKTAYSMFLADKTVLAMLKTKYPDYNLSKLNKQKGIYYREEVKGTELYEKYAEKARLVNGDDETIEEITEEVETTEEKPKKKRGRKPKKINKKIKPTPVDKNELTEEVIEEVTE